MITSVRVGRRLPTLFKKICVNNHPGSGAARLSSGKVVVFDSECMVCDTSVQFLIARDPSKALKFCGAQSKAAIPLLAAHNLTPADALRSVIFIEDNIAYERSAAPLRIARYLPRPYSMLAIAVEAMIPRIALDTAYDAIAMRRHLIRPPSWLTWWTQGRTTASGGNAAADESHSTCLVMTRPMQERFLDAPEIMEKLRRKCAQ